MPKMTLPSGITIEYRGMTGRDEDLLTNRKKLMSGEAMDEILKNCIIDFGGKAPMLSDVEALISPDRIALLLAIRIESYGDSMDVELDCGNEACAGNKTRVTVDLSTIESTPLPEGEGGFEVTVEGKRVKFGYLTGKKERALAKTKEDLLTTAMALRLIEVEGIHANDHKKWLRDLPVAGRRTLRDAMAATDAGPQTVKTADCSSCGNELRFDVQAQVSFFFPAT